MSANVIVTEQLRVQAEAITARLPPDEELNLQLRVHESSSSTAVDVPVPDELGRFIHRILDSLATNTAIQIGSLPEIVSTTVAAKMLGISRPTLMKLVQEGRLESTRVGTHTRLRTDDVLALEAARAVRRSDGFVHMRSVAEDLGVDN